MKIHNHFSFRFWACLLISLIFIQATHAQSVQELEDQLRVANNQIRVLSLEKGRLEREINEIDPRVRQQLVDAQVEVLRIESAVKSQLKKNLTKSSLTLGLSTAQAVLDAVGGVRSALNVFLKDTIVNKAIDSLYSGLSAPYKQRIAVFKAEAISTSLKVEKVQKLINANLESIRNIAAAQGDDIDSTTGLIYRKYYLVLQAIGEARTELETLVINLDEFATSTEAELILVGARLDNKFLEALAAHSALQEKREEIRDQKVAQKVASAKSTLGNPQVQALPGVSPQSDEETAREQYLKVFEAAKLVVAATWPNLVDELEAVQSGINELFETTTFYPLLEAPDSLSDLGVDSHSDSLTETLWEYRDSEVELLEWGDRSEHHDAEIGIYEQLESAAGSLLALELDREEWLLYANAVDDYYTVLVGGTPSTSDSLVSYLAQLALPEGYNDEELGAAYLSTFLGEIELLRNELDRRFESKEILDSNLDILTQIFNEQMQVKLDRIKELQDAFGQMKSAHQSCHQASASWDAYLLGKGWSFVPPPPYLSYIAQDGNYYQIPGAELVRWRMLQDIGLATPEDLPGMMADWLQLNYSFNEKNNQYTAARKQLLSALLIHKEQNDRGGPNDWVADDLETYDYDWARALGFWDLNQELGLKPIIPDLSDFTEMTYLAKEGSTAFKETAALLFPGNHGDRELALKMFSIADILVAGEISWATLSIDAQAALVNRELDKLGKLIDGNLTLIEGFEPIIGSAEFAAELIQGNVHSAMTDEYLMGLRGEVLPPVITTQPGNFTIGVGHPVSLSVTAEGEGILLYLWEKVEGEFGVTISNGYRSTLELPSLVETALFRVTVFNSSVFESGATSNLVTVTVDEAVGFTVAPIVSLVPTEGGTHSLSITASDSSHVWSVRSLSNWIVISSARNGTGSDSIFYTTSANLSGAEREGTIVVAGRVVTVKQEFTPTDFDDWRKDHLGNENADPLEDLTGDGVNNILNFSMGTDPNENNQDKKPSLIIEEDSEGGLQACFRYRRSKLATQVNFIVRTSEDMRNWEESTEPHILESDDGDSWIYLIELKLKERNAEDFFTLEVEFP